MNAPALALSPRPARVPGSPLDPLSPGAPPRPMVSILLITYNHEKYIAQAIESILMQETEYVYEINVIEDCSTDSTQEIVMRYVERHPHIVKPYFNKKNIGYKVTQKNFYRGFKTLTGNYFAILEGDDYWTSPHKIQKQVAFLESHPEFAISAHNTVKMYEDGSKESHRFLYWGQQPDTDIEDAVRLRSFFHTTGLIYRNVYRGVPPKQFENKWSCDIFIYIAHAQFGKIRHLDEDMAVYRAHDGGRFSNMPLIGSWMFNIDGLRRYNAWLKYRHLTGFSEAITRYCASVLNQEGKGEAQPLNWHQKLKCYCLMVMYGSIAYFFGLPARLKKYRGEMPGGFFHIFSLLLADASRMLYKLAVAIAPESTKTSLRRLDTSLPDAQKLRTLISEGRLLTREGMKQLFAVARQYAGKAADRVSGPKR